MKINKFLLFMLFVLIAQVAWAAQISNIEIEKHKYFDNVYIITSEYVKPKTMLLDNPPRLVLDFSNVKIGDASQFEGLESNRLKQIRIGQFSEEPLVARVVLDLNQMVDYEVATIFGTNKTVVEIRDTKRPYIYKAAKPPPSSKIDTLPVGNQAAEPKLPVTLKQEKVAPQIVKVEKAEAAKPGPKAVKDKIVTKEPDKKIVVKPPILKGKVIVVDPGHGGQDPGAFGLYGLIERQLTLQTAYRLVEFLKKAGATVYLTRKNNVKVDLKEVVAFTNRIRADAYIGIHYNAAYNSRINGMETYYYHASSKRLAQIVHKSIRGKIKRPDRGIRRAMLYTVHHAQMPAIIVEPAFLTNPVDARLLQSGQFLKSVAWGVTAGLKEYFR